MVTENEEPVGDITADKLVGAYIKVRNKRKELSDAFESADASLKEKMAAIESHILKICNEMKATGFKTTHGTVARTTKTRYWTSDMASFHEFILDHRVPQLLEGRIAQGNMKTYLEQHPDELPPGLNTDTKYAVVITKPRKP